MICSRLPFWLVRFASVYHLYLNRVCNCPPLFREVGQLVIRGTVRLANKSAELTSSCHAPVAFIHPLRTSTPSHGGLET